MRVLAAANGALAADSSAQKDGANQEWAIDFASYVAASGQRLRIFSVVDSYTRECLALELDTSMPSRRITRALGNVITLRGRPVAIRSDNVLNASLFSVCWT
ncbi:MAG: DDE-type integrase/transposase/recombinase [Acidobacteriota bacterium]